MTLATSLKATKTIAFAKSMNINNILHVKYSGKILTF